MAGTITDQLERIRRSSETIATNTSIEYGAGATTAKTQRVAIASDANSVVFASPQAVTGTFWQTTQPVSAVSLPLPTGASTSANQIPAFTNQPTNFGAVNQVVVKGSAGVVYKVYCYNKSTSTRFFQIHDKTTPPVNTDVPIESFPIAANSALIIDSTFWGATGRVCSAGVSWAFSTTEATLTLGTAADQTSSVGYL